MKKTIQNLLLTSSFSLVCITLIFAGPAEDKERAKKKFEFGKTAFSGLHQVYPFTKGHQNEKAPDTYTKCHAKWVTFADIVWEEIEPSAPSGVKHRYNWEQLDKTVALWQKKDFQLAMQVNPRCKWAQGAGKFNSVADNKLKTAIRNAALPPANPAAFADFMQAVAERYDNDGLDDAKDLKYPVYVYEVLDEPQNPLRWNGTSAEYIKLLEAVSIGIKKANADALLVVPNFSFKGLSHATKNDDEFNRKLEEFAGKKSNEDEKAFCRHYFEFIRDVLSNSRSYDVVGIQACASIEEMLDDLAYVKKFVQPAKPVWVTSSTSTPPLLQDSASFWSSAYVDGEKWLKVLASPKDKQYDKVRNWYLSEQSKYSVKKIIAALGNGAQRFMLGTLEDRPGEDGNYNSYDGLVEARWDAKTDNCEYGAFRPAFMSYKLLNRWVDGFTAVEPMKLGKGVSGYKFTVKNRPAYVIWFEDTQVPGPDVRRAEKIVEITSDRQMLDIVYMFSDPSQTGPVISREPVKDGKILVRAGDLPILIIDEYVP